MASIALSLQSLLELGVAELGAVVTSSQPVACGDRGTYQERLSDRK